ncbi:MAG: thymidylate synthase [Chloroflexales bacterium]|nr:thymidylate synthase [Chloroflexales bacterium]
MDWPLYFAQNLALGAPASGVGLCLLWTPQERILPALSPGSYAVAGNLYSRDGISFLVRNVLARPTIRALVLCGKDMTGSGAALVALMLHGIDANHCVVGEGTRLHRELPREAIELFRRSVRLIDARDTTRPEAIAALLAYVPHHAEPFVPEALIFPYSEPALDTLPAESSGFVVHAPTVRSAHLALLWHVMSFGQRSGTQHSSDQRELLDVMTVVSDEPVAPDDCSYADWMPFSLESLGQRQADGRFSRYLGQFLHTDHALSGVSYTYGDRLRAYGHGSVDQIAAMIDDLRRSRHSRRAVATVWNPEHDPHSSNPPCLNLVQARLCDDVLHVTAYFRSHDIYRAWAMNAFGLRALQGLLTEALQKVAPVKPGDLVIISQSAHIYAHDWEVVNDVLAHHYRPANPRLVRDPRGSFVISLEPPDATTDVGGAIVVRHYTPEGEHLQTLQGMSARELGRQLSPYISNVNHAIYLGQELQKAEIALRWGNPEAYRQDRELDV